MQYVADSSDVPHIASLPPGFFSSALLLSVKRKLRHHHVSFGEVTQTLL